MSENADVLLKVEDVKVHFPVGRKGLTGEQKIVHAVDGVSFDVRRGTAFGLVGESGSGKTTTALACVRLVDQTAGRITLGDTDITALSGEKLRQLRRRIQIIFQDPYSSLNPRERVGAIVRRPLDILKIGSKQERQARVDALFELVGLRPEQKQLFPHQFSGGQRQRIGVARALASEPDLIVCDEPVSALDVAIQAQVLNLLMRLKQKLGLTYLFISHDLGVMQHVCDDIAVMYLGKIVEQGSRRQVFSDPRHPYTKALLSSVPSAKIDDDASANRVRLTGEPPSPIDVPTGCRFKGRCPVAISKCGDIEPALRTDRAGHKVACHLAE